MFTRLAVNARLKAAVTMAPMSATPNTPPSSRLLFVPAEATPACRVGTDANTAAVIGAMVRAIPDPHTIIDGKITPRYDESACDRSINARPMPDSVVPAVMNHLDPNRSDRRPAMGASSRIITGNGNSRMPAPRGEYPWTCWKYSVRKKTVPNSAKNTDAATTFAAANVRMRKNDNGSIGDSARDSIQKNAASRTAARPNDPRMRPSVHP